MNSEHANRPLQFDQSIARRTRAFSERLIRYAVDWIDEKRYIDEHRRYIDEIDKSGELDSLLVELDVTRKQLNAFAISPLASAELLTRMIERIGFVDGQIPAATRELAEQQCRLCENWKLCRRWLNRSEQNEEYRSFCLNTDLFDRLHLELSGKSRS